MRNVGDRKTAYVADMKGKAMAEYHIPEIDALTKTLADKMDDHLANLDDFADAIKSSNDPVEIIEIWETRQLLRKLPPDSLEQ